MVELWLDISYSQFYIIIIQNLFFNSQLLGLQEGNIVTILRDTVTTSWSADDICLLILNISCWSDILVLYVFSSTLPDLACYKHNLIHVAVSKREKKKTHLDCWS